MRHDPLYRPSKRPTLEDVGAQAGVSRAMASIVLRGAPGGTAETRERIMRAAKELGYRADARARLLASTSRPLLGVVFSRYGLFHLELLDGLYQAAENVGCEVILTALTAHRGEQRAMETLLDFRCDAVILLGPEGGTPRLAGRLPCVVVGWKVRHSSVDVVRSSDEQGGQQILDHLVEMGHRDIAHVGGPGGPVSVARQRSYREAMRRHGLESRVREVPGGSTQQQGVQAAREILSSGDLPTAVTAFNDEVAAGLLETFRGSGVAVPADISVVGWDDSSLAKLPHVDLTTVHQDVTTLGRLAVERCIARVQHLDIDAREVTVPTRLVVRTSTGRPRTTVDRV
ncbi:LacI family DNA-binding transcriptional regulator [Nakamurella sp. GG22]